MRLVVHVGLSTYHVIGRLSPLRCGTTCRTYHVMGDETPDDVVLGNIFVYDEIKRPHTTPYLK